MAIISDYDEQDNKPLSSSSVSKKPFNAVLDSANPLGFLETVFEFLGRESDIFKSNSLVSDVNAVVRMVKDKLETEEKKRKENVQGSPGKAEKKYKEDVPVVEKAEEVKEAMEEDKKGPLGIFCLFYLSKCFCFSFSFTGVRDLSGL